jgi:bacteriorhodopsin
MVMFVLPVIILIALVASLPIWPHSKKWGFYPISGVSVIILIILLLFWTGHLSQR